MNFFTVNYYLNQTYNVEDTAIKQMIEAAIKEVKNVKLNSSKVTINKNAIGFSASIIIEIKNTVPLKDTMINIQNELESKSIALTSAKPENIEIIIQGVA